MTRIFSRGVTSGIGLWTSIGVLLAFILFPIVWITLVAFKPRAETFVTPLKWVPERFTLENFREVFAQLDFGTALGNSLFVSFSAAFLAVTVGALSGYALSRFDFPGKRFFAASMLVFMAFPLFLLLLPVRLLFGAYGLLNTHIGLIVAYTTFYLPIAIWLLKTYFDTVPRELDDAAMVDGCNRFTAFWFVIVPSSGPGLFSAGLIVFLLAWHEYMFAVVLIDTAALRTLPLALDSFIQEYTIQWNRLIAASVAAIVPVVVIAALFQRQLLRVISGGALKD